MAYTIEDVTNFLQVAIPDLNQEIDRICMAVLEIDLQKMAADATSRDAYDEGVRALKASLYGPPAKGQNDDLNPLYPGQHLAYYVQVRADWWRQTQNRGGPPKPVPTLPSTVAAIRELLVAAKRVQTIIEEQSGAWLALWIQGHDQVSAQAFHVQSETLDRVVARLPKLEAMAKAQEARAQEAKAQEAKAREAKAQEGVKAAENAR